MPTVTTHTRRSCIMGRLLWWLPVIIVVVVGGSGASFFRVGAEGGTDTAHTILTKQHQSGSTRNQENTAPLLLHSAEVVLQRLGMTSIETQPQPQQQEKEAVPSASAPPSPVIVECIPTPTSKQSKSQTNSSSQVIPIDASASASDWILFPVVVELVGCFMVYFLTKYSSLFPYEAVMFMIGAGMGAVSVLSMDAGEATQQTDPGYHPGHMQNSIAQWSDLDADLLLMMFLPGLIFKEAVEVPFNLFVRSSGQVLIFAFPMVLVGTVLTAAAAYYCLPYQAETPEMFGWASWITLGSILASTDPIAVAAVLKSAGASPRLVMHITGESLLNDGSSVVFFTIAMNVWFDYLELEPENSDLTDSHWNMFIFFVRMSVGGTLVGGVFGFGLNFLLGELDTRMEKNHDILQPVCALTVSYICYWFCDELLTTSGIIAVVTCGLVVNRYGKGLINDEKLMHEYLVLTQFLLDTLLFALGGLIWGTVSFSSLATDTRSISMIDWGWLLFFYILMVLIRFIVVGLFYPIVSRIGLQSDWKESAFFAFGGLHGSVGVALCLNLVQSIYKVVEDEADPRRYAANIMIFLGGGGTLLTLIINGTSAGLLLEFLGLSTPPVPEDVRRRIFEGTAKDFVYTQLQHLLEENRFRNVRFDVLKDAIPFVTKEPPRTIVLERSNSGVNGSAVRHLEELVCGGGKPYMMLIQAAECAADHWFMQKREDQLLIEMRQIFLEILGKAYATYFREANLAQHESILYDVFVQSLALAVNDVKNNNEPINDWVHTEGFFVGSTKKDEKEYMKHEEARTQSTVLRRASLISYHAVDADILDHVDDMPTARKKAKKLRLNVCRALAFKKCHEMAERKLQMYVNRFDDLDDANMQSQHEIMQSCLDQVLSESRDQVSYADALLHDDASDKDVEIITSFYCAMIVIRQLIKFIESKVEDDLIQKQEARKYVQIMNGKLAKVEYKCVEWLAELICQKHSNTEFPPSYDSMKSDMDLIKGEFGNDYDSDYEEALSHPQNADATTASSIIDSQRTTNYGTVSQVKPYQQQEQGEETEVTTEWTEEQLQAIAAANANADDTTEERRGSKMTRRGGV